MQRGTVALVVAGLQRAADGRDASRGVGAGRVERPRKRYQPQCMADQTSSGGWVVEILGSGSGGRRRNLVGIADKATAIAAIRVELGNEAHITSVTRVPEVVLEIAKVMPGKIVEV
jgi:hypothetical protein